MDDREQHRSIMVKRAIKVVTSARGAYNSGVIIINRINVFHYLLTFIIGGILGFLAAIIFNFGIEPQYISLLTGILSLIGVIIKTKRREK